MIQDSLPSDEPVSTSANPGLVERISEATESEANRHVMQDLQHPDERILHRSSDSVEEVSAVTESEAVRLLAARIPPELFDDILFYVNEDRLSQHQVEYTALIRNQGEPSPNDILTDLKRCSIVCLFWANRCRQHMFSGGTLEIKSYQDAEIFRRYVVGGCPRLTPVHQLIKRIDVTQNYSGELTSQPHKRQTSFLHLLYLPTIQDKLVDVSIYGPVPAGFNPAKLDTPHWGISPSVVVPSSFLRHDISITYLHLPSFYHVTRYIRHFSCATFIKLRTITWGRQTPTYSLPHSSNKIACQRRPRSLGIYVEGVCTNSVHLALTAVMMNPNCPLHRLSDDERMWMTKFMTLLWGDEPDPDVRIDFDVSEQATTMRLHHFYFAFEGAPLTDRPASALSVVGVHAYIWSDDLSFAKLPANFDALVNHARTHPTVPTLVLLFESLYFLQQSLKPLVKVLTLAAETIELVLAYEERGKKKAVGVDLVTLEPSGVIWADVERCGCIL